MSASKNSTLNMFFPGSNQNRYGGIIPQKTASFGSNPVVGKKAFGSFGQQSNGLGSNMAMRAAPTAMSATPGPWNQETVDALEAKSQHQRLIHLEE